MLRDDSAGPIQSPISPSIVENTAQARPPKDRRPARKRKIAVRMNVGYFMISGSG